MIPVNLDLEAWRAAIEATAGAASPLALALALTTLLVEDLAIAAGAALATSTSISWELAFAAVAGGIAAGDLGLYALGALARRWSFLARRLERRALAARAAALRARLVRDLPSAVLLARVIPGLRLLTYTASGLLRVDLKAFTLWVLLAVSLWTLALFALAGAIGAALAAALHIPPALAVILPVAAFALAVPLLRRRRLTSQPE
jgi:membrane protein DedA with SNARE-associated domain